MPIKESSSLCALLQEKKQELIGETRNETNVHDVPTPIVSSNKEIQSTISNEDHGKRFWAPSRSWISASQNKSYRNDQQDATV
jgi:hypothetical protein